MIIATNINEEYYNRKHKLWVDSVNKYFKDESLIFTMGFSLEGSLQLELDKLPYSKHPRLKNRANFVCLESGEFVDFIDYPDDEILILTDWDLVVQREFLDVELDALNSLGEYEFGMNRDHYPCNKLKGYLGIDKAHSDISDDWIVYNTGVQAGRVSAWKKLFEYWKGYYDETYAKMTHHATGQALFNYIIQKHGMVKEMPLTFHNAHWFHGTPSKIQNNQLYVGDDLVCFNHHKWAYQPTF